MTLHTYLQRHIAFNSSKTPSNDLSKAMLRKASTERVHKAATVRKITTLSYCCTANLFTLDCPPLSSIKYDKEHLMMLGSFLGCFPCRRCAISLDDTGSKWLQELCPLLLFPLNYSVVQQLAKCCRGIEKKRQAGGGVWAVQTH